MQQNPWDVIIIGGGPAGLSAALMLGRSRRRTLVIDAGRPRNRFAAHMHAVLGSDGAAPGELLARGRAEASGYGVEFLTASVDRVDRAGALRGIRTDDGREHLARAVIVATGITDALPDVPGLAERWGTSVLHCPYCHGWEVRDRRLGLLATSTAGLHQAQLLRQLSPHVTVFTADAGDIAADTAARLRARGIRLEPTAVVELTGPGTELSEARLADDRRVPLDALFTAGEARPHDGFLAPLELARTGNLLSVDAAGRTGDEHVWAIGNVVAPMANVPLSMGAGALTGGAVNAALTDWDVDDAIASAWPEVATRSFWEQRYAGHDALWSGRANPVLTAIAAELPVGRALDIGSGEGADVIWLAQHGWEATGVEASAIAAQRAASAAERAGVTAGFSTDDLAELPEHAWDLVTLSYLHSPADRSRPDLLRLAAARVARGGHLLITSHVGAPSGSAHAKHAGRFPTPAEELERLALPAHDWETVLVEVRPRAVPDRDAARAPLDDGVVLLRRR